MPELLLFSPIEFNEWIARQNVARTVLYIQQHHTWSPSYKHFTGSNHIALQKGMRNFHRTQNGWQDIGQHFTIFPDGKIVTGRNLEVSPACIFGANANAICIENVGNFDTGGDTMSEQQRESIVSVTAALCKRFNIPVNTDRIVYHHWYDLSTGARTNGTGKTKTCPGTNFFGGNTVEAASELISAVQSAINPQAKEPEPEQEKPVPICYGMVVSDSLNVRNGPNKQGRKINTVLGGSVVRVYGSDGGYLKISASKQEWIQGRYVKPINAPVTAPGLFSPFKLSVWDEVFMYNETALREAGITVDNSGEPDNDLPK